MTKLYYFHDPMCSWCWGYRPTAQRVFANLPDGVERINVLGGLAPDSDKPMPPALQETIKGHWRRIETLLGTQFNYDFWTQCQPRRSTWLSCRAVIAAARQGQEEAMILAIQTAYYLQARNPSDAAVLVSLATQEGLDTDLFTNDLHAAETELELQRQIAFTRSSPAPGFPALALQVGDGLVSIPVDYQNHSATLAKIAEVLTA